MKYVIFTLAALIVVPWFASLAQKSAKNRAVLFGIMVFSPTLGAKTAINYVSIETYRGVDRGFQVTLTDLIAWGLLLYFVQNRPPNVKRFLPGVWLMIAFFGLALISAFQAPVLLYAMFTIWKLVRLYIIFWVTANMLRIGTPTQALFYGWTMMALVLAGDCFLQKYKMGMYRVNGFFDHSNSIPIFVLQALSFVLLTALGDKKVTGKWVWFGVVGALGMTFSVVATQSRMGVMVSAVILMLTLVMANLISKEKRTRVVSACVFTVILIGAGMAAKTMMDRIKNAPESSAEARQEFNTAAKMMASEHPLGVGINSFSSVLSKNSHYNAGFEVMANEIEEGQAGVAHHIYYLTAAEIGLPGLFVFLSLIAWMMLIGMRAAWKARGTLAGSQSVSLVIGALAVHIIGNFEYALRITPVCSNFAMLCGATAGYFYLNGRPAPKQIRTRPATRPLEMEPANLQSNLATVA